jgi:uncharacterized tellurite resistance protein B-like protein
MLDEIINWLAYGSLFFGVVAAYLQINKLWQRKHLPDVAESISISGVMVESIPLLFFGIYFIKEGELIGIIDSIIWLICAGFFVMMGSGLWVRGQRDKGFWSLALGSVRRERKEISALAKQMIYPSAAPELIAVLTKMAVVDGELSTHEVALIQPFVTEWGLEVDWDQLQPAADKSSSSRIIEVQGAVDSYLAKSPPHSQAAQLKELLTLLINADDSVASEEQTAFAEVSGLIDQYLAEEDELQPGFEVLIAPQNPEQEAAVMHLLKNVSTRSDAGGKGFSVGSYFSQDYAELVCLEYRELGFFTVVMERETAQSL